MSKSKSFQSLNEADKTSSRVYNQQDDVKLLPITHQVHCEQQESKSYPGLHTAYERHFVEAHTRVLPSGGTFQTKSTHLSSGDARNSGVRSSDRGTTHEGWVVSAGGEEASGGGDGAWNFGTPAFSPSDLVRTRYWSMYPRDVWLHLCAGKLPHDLVLTDTSAMRAGKTNFPQSPASRSRQMRSPKITSGVTSGVSDCMSHDSMTTQHASNEHTQHPPHMHHTTHFKQIYTTHVTHQTYIFSPCDDTTYA
jgi:hypothetical protein